MQGQTPKTNVTTEITTWQAVKVPAPTPQHAQSLSPQELADHRAKIAFEVEVIMDGYWQTQPREDIKAGILADWCDTLQDWTHEQVVWALRKWRNDNPSKRPNPGHILGICKAARGKKVAEKMRAAEKPEAPKERISKERAAEILAEVGFAPKRMDDDSEKQANITPPTEGQEQ